MNLWKAFLLLTVTCVTAQTSEVADAFAALKAPTDEMLPGKGPAQSGDWFDQVWSERRAEFRRGQETDKGAVVFLGDSITRGWGDLSHHFPDYQCANRGISGDTTRGILFRLNEDVLDLEPAAIVLLIGTNDIGIGADPADVADNIKAILAAIRRRDESLPVVVCKVMPRADGVPNAASSIEELNRRVTPLVEADSNCIPCDTWSIFGDDGTATREEFPDLLHLNEAGYGHWKAALLPILAELKLPASS